MRVQWAVESGHPFVWASAAWACLSVVLLLVFAVGLACKWPCEAVANLEPVGSSVAVSENALAGLQLLQMSV